MPLVPFSGSVIIKLFLKMSNYFGNNLFQMLKIQRKLQKHKNEEFDGNSRASCEMPIHHCRASIQ
jgi:hypothetical protein